MEEKIKRDKEAGLESHNYIQYICVTRAKCEQLA